MKKMISLILAFCMIVILSISAFSTNLTDVTDPYKQDRAAEGQISIYYDDYVSSSDVHRMTGTDIHETITVPTESSGLLEYADGFLHAKGVGLGSIMVGDTAYSVTVQKANIHLALIMGQSNAVGVVNNVIDLTGSTECKKGSAYLWNKSAVAPAYLTPQSGYQSAFAAEWYAQSGNSEKVVLVYEENVTARRGMKLEWWNETKLAEISTMYNNAVSYFEAHTDLYEVTKRGMYWLQGESDQNMAADLYYNGFRAMWNSLKEKTANALDYCGIFRVRMNEVSRTNIAYTGPVAAQYKLTADNADIFMASTLTENWSGSAATVIMLDTSMYKAVSYPDNVALGDIYDGLHYARIGYNTLGADAAYHMYRALDTVPKEYTVILGEATGKPGMAFNLQDGSQTIDLDTIKENFTLYLAPGSGAGKLDVVVADKNGADITSKVTSGCLYLPGAFREENASVVKITVKDADDVVVLRADLPVMGADSTMTTHAGDRTTICINNNWRFQYEANVTEAIAVDTDEALWKAISIPHTWNAEDGTNGGNNYNRGKGWYRKNVTIPSDFSGKEVYLEFDGVNTLTCLYIDGTRIPYTDHEGATSTTHNGGYTGFRYRITDYVSPGQTHLIAVCADNSKVMTVAPIEGDWTFYGGIYRDVNLVAVPKTHFDMLDYGSTGLYITALPKDNNDLDGEWILTVQANLVNSDDKETTVDIKTTLRQPEEFIGIHEISETLTPFDENSMYGDAVIATAVENVTIPAESVYSYTKTYTVTDPRLWNGKNDPYRYQFDAEICVGGTCADKVTDYIGFRTFSVDRDTGFYLNGESYPLRGVSRHQDFMGIGNALSKEHHDLDFGMIYDIGANAVRLAHYPHDEYFYDLCDRYGLVVWAEIPLIGSIAGKGEYGSFDQTRTDYVENVKDQLVEMIRSKYNHPSIMFWGLQNEINNSYNSVATPVMKELHALAKAEDPNRYTTHATFHTQGLYWESDLAAMNLYAGWYGYEPEDFADVRKTFFTDASTGITASFDKNAFPPVASSEYGAGGGIKYHVEDATLPESRPGSFGDRVHPEEYQTYLHEEAAKALDTPGQLDYLWASFIWNMFDFGSDNRSEGDDLGINDKGLVTFDRSVKKDSYYVYKAIWSDDPFVHAQRRRFTVRDLDAILVKASSNCDTVSFSVNGGEPKLMTDNGHGQFSFENCPLKLGENVFIFTGVKNGVTYTDTVTFTRQKSVDTTIFSDKLTIDNDKKSIILSSGSFTAGAVENYVSSQKNASFTILYVDDNGEKQPLTDEATVDAGMYLRVTAEDGLTVADYIFVQNYISFEKAVTIDETESVSVLTDGSKTTSWERISPTYPITLDIDLGKKYYTNSFLLDAENTYSYTVSVSLDGETFINVNTPSSGNALYTDNLPARYVRFTIMGGNADKITLDEAEIHGWCFDTTAYTIDEDNRVIVTNTLGVDDQIGTSTFIETLGLAGNMTYSLSSAQYFFVDGDTLSVMDNCNKVTEYTICTGNGCANKHTVNAALRKPIIKMPTYQADHPVPNAIDGRIDTRWAASYSFKDAENNPITTARYPEAFTVDLGAEYLIDAFDLLTFGYEYGNNRSYSYEILVSRDNVDFIQVVDRLNNSDLSGIYYDALKTPVLARYVTLNVTDCSRFPASNIATAGVYEFEVRGRLFDGKPTGMSVKYDTIILSPGTDEQIDVRLIPDFASLPKDLTFTSGNTNIATVDEHGYVLGVAKGETTVTVSSASLSFETKIAVTVADKRVLSLKRPIVEASDKTGQMSGHFPEKINDGITARLGGEDSRWQCMGGDKLSYPQYLVIDLERICRIDAIDVDMFGSQYSNNRYYGYNLYGSLNGTDFTLLTDNSANTDKSGYYTHTYDAPQEARFIKIEVTGCSNAGSSAGVNELTVFGDDLYAPIEKIEFVQSQFRMVLDGIVENVFTVYPANGDLSSVRIKADAENIVEIDASGTMKAVGIGETVVNVYDGKGNVLASCEVRVDRYGLVSLGKPAVDYSVEGVLEPGTNFANFVDKLTDGKVPSTDYNFERWHVTDQNIHYVTIDLQAEYLVKEIDVHFFYYNNRAHGYRLSASSDNITFTTICDRLDNTKTGIIKENTDVKARYIKLEISKPNVGGSPSSTAGVYELSVYGEAPSDAPVYGVVSVGKPVVDYSDIGQPDNEIDRLTDGEYPDTADTTAPRWQATSAMNDSEYHYLTVDLQDVYEIDKVELYFFFYSNRAHGFRLSASLDGETFVTVCDKLGNTTNGVITETFQPVKARYVKLEVTKPTSGATPGVYEMLIFGTHAEEEEAPIPSITIGEEGIPTDTHLFDFGTAVAGTVIACAYDSDGRLAMVSVVKDTALPDGKIEVKAQSGLTIKAFAFENSTSLRPLGEAFEIR